MKSSKFPETILLVGTKLQEKAKDLMTYTFPLFIYTTLPNVYFSISRYSLISSFSIQLGSTEA